VGRIELDVDNLQADINLNAQVANLVSLNAGIAVSVQKINLTIVDVEAELEYDQLSFNLWGGLKIWLLSSCNLPMLAENACLSPLKLLQREMLT
jgi:hypothetical protein